MPHTVGIDKSIYIYTIPCKPPHGRVAGGVRTPAVYRMGGVGGEDL
jgi:hypothetical protein